MRALSNFFIENPIIKWVVVVLVALGFLFSVRQIKRYAFPRVDLNQVYIRTTVPGFSAREVESEVTVKIEDKLKNITGIELFTSTSYQNFSFISIDIEPNISDDEVRKVKDSIRNEVGVISDFPDALLEDPVITEVSIDNKPMVVLGVVSTRDDLRSARKHALAIKKLLLQTDEVSQVKESIQEEQVLILLNGAKLNQYNLSIEEVIGKLEKNQVRLTSGILKKDSEVKRLMTYAKAESVADIRNLVIRSSGRKGQAVVIRLHDIANVEVGLEPATKVVKFNGFSGYQLELLKKGDADIIDATKNINNIIRDYELAEKEKFNSDFKVVIHDDDSQETKERLTIVYENALFGLVLVCLTVFFFLNRSTAFWSCLGIPSTFFLSISFMWMAGISINTVSLCGIIIMMGIIVDNPTIIGESVFHYRQLGFGKKKASLTTLDRILKPLLFAGLTTVASFGSMFFIPGTLGQFASEIPMVVIFMLIASFFESTLILPAQLAHSNMSLAKPWGDKFIISLKKMYEKTLTKALRRPLLSTLAMGGFLVVGVLFTIFFVKFELFPLEQAFKMNLSGKTEINSSLQFSEKQADILNDVVNTYREEGNKNIVASSRVTVGETADNEFEIQVRLVSYFDRKTTIEEFKDYVVAEVEKRRSSNLPESSRLDLESFDYFIDSGGVPSGRPVEINVFSRDIKDRKTVITQITSDLKEKGYFSEVFNTLKEGKLEYRVVPNEQASFANIDANKISQGLRVAYEGVKVGNSEIGDNSLDWWLKYDDASKDFDDPLKGMYVLNNRYQRVAISDLVDVIPVTTVSQIQHEDGNRKDVISANFDTSQVSATEVYRYLTKKYANIQDKYPNVRLVFGGEAKKSTDTLSDFIFAIFGSVIFIYLLLVVQFSSFVQPFMVITSIPFGIVGIVVAFTFHGYSLSFLGMIGVLGFGGVVINASLVMVDYINEIKNGKVFEEKLSRSDFVSETDYLCAVVVRGASLRFRPILITTFTTVIGLVPTSYGILGRTDVMIAPMTLTMMWGLFFGTLGGLYAVPIFYFFDQKMSNFFKKS